MKPLPLLVLLALLLTARTHVYSAAPAVTWAAQGLPPGLMINASTGAITGKPTQAGNFTAIVYPKIGSATGGMGPIKITVLPAGMNLPTYYFYNRLTSTGDYLSSYFTAGGGGYIWAVNQTLNTPVVTTDGTTFSEPNLPPNITQVGGYWNQGAAFAVCGTKTLYLGADGSGIVHCLLSTKGGAFYDVGMPSINGTVGQGSASIASDGVKSFYLNLHYYDQDGGIISSTWQSSSQSISWTQIGTNIQNSQATSISVAVFGKTKILCFGDGSGFLVSKDGGITFTNDTTQTQITSIAYGNGRFLGTGNAGTGVWSSTDGQNWSQISAVDPGTIIYSSYEKLFFSSGNSSSGNSVGVASASTDGIYWISYQYSGGGYGYQNGSIASSGTGIVFWGGYQLSTNTITNWGYGTFQTSVGKSTTITATH